MELNNNEVRKTSDTIGHKYSVVNQNGDKVIFLDRDGTLNAEVNYLHRTEDLLLLPGVIKAVERFNKAGYTVIVVTNQAGVARGYYTETDVKALHEHMNGVLRQSGAHVDKFYYCPHHPEHGVGAYKTDCLCRKPGIGMFEQAEAELPSGIDKAHSYMIGDKLIDTQAGRRYGVRSILVGTGYGKEIRSKQEQNGLIGIHGECLDESYDYYAENLAAAADLIIKE